MTAKPPIYFTKDLADQNKCGLAWSWSIDDERACKNPWRSFWDLFPPGASCKASNRSQNETSSGRPDLARNELLNPIVWGRIIPTGSRRGPSLKKHGTAPGGG